MEETQAMFGRAQKQVREQVPATVGGRQVEHMRSATARPSRSYGHPGARISDFAAPPAPIQREKAGNAGVDLSSETGAAVGPNPTALPGRLKAGVENLSGFAMHDVRVHRNSAKPAEVGALAYTQGANIYVGPGQDKHLPHEAWHVVQQLQGWVKPTTRLDKGLQVNDDAGLEREATVMGARAARAEQGKTSADQLSLRAPLLPASASPPIQRITFPKAGRDLQVSNWHNLQVHLLGGKEPAKREQSAKPHEPVVSEGSTLHEESPGSTLSESDKEWLEKTKDELLEKWKRLPEEEQESLQRIKRSDREICQIFATDRQNASIAEARTEANRFYNCFSASPYIVAMTAFIVDMSVGHAAGKRDLDKDDVNKWFQEACDAYKKGEEHEYKRTYEKMRFRLYGITPQQQSLGARLLQHRKEYEEAAREKQAVKDELKGKDLSEEIPRLQAESRRTGQNLDHDIYFLVRLRNRKESARKELAHSASAMKELKGDEYSQAERKWIEEQGIDVPDKRTEVSRQYSRMYLKINGLRASLKERDGKVDRLKKAGHGSISYEGKFELFAGIGGSLAEAQMFGEISGGHGLSIQDDRRFRSTGFWKVTGGGRGSLFNEALAASRAYFHSKSTSLAFARADDYKAYNSKELYEGLMQVRAQIPDAALDPETRSALSSLESEMRDVKYTEVTSKQDGGESDQKVLGFEGHGSKWHESLKFVRSDAQDSKGKGAADHASCSLSVGPFHASIQISSIKNHMNPHNDGTYLNVKIAMTQEVKFKASNEPEPEKGKLDDFKVGEKADMASLQTHLKKHLETCLPAGCPQGKFGVGGEVDLPTYEWNFVREENKWVLQYHRLSMGAKVGVEGRVQAGLPGIVHAGVGGGGSAQGALMQHESLGADTLSYVETVFDGYIGKVEGEDPKKGHSWGEWVKWRDKHQEEIKTILSKLQEKKDREPSLFPWLGDLSLTLGNLESILLAKKRFRPERGNYWITRNRYR